MRFLQLGEQVRWTGRNDTLGPEIESQIWEPHYHELRFANTTGNKIAIESIFCIKKLNNWLKKKYVKVTSLSWVYIEMKMMLVSLLLLLLLVKTPKGESELFPLLIRRSYVPVHHRKGKDLRPTHRRFNSPLSLSTLKMEISLSAPLVHTPPKPSARGNLFQSLKLRSTNASVGRPRCRY